MMTMLGLAACSGCSLRQTKAGCSHCRRQYCSYWCYQWSWRVMTARGEGREKGFSRRSCWHRWCWSWPGRRWTRLMLLMVQQHWR